MLRETTASAMAGAACGVVMFLAFGRLLAGLVYATTVRDPAIMTSAVAVMGVAAVAAAWLQVRRIADVSPASVMRQD
jgi:ABC-type antimicrobial peptide transport system permease subunit